MQKRKIGFYWLHNVEKIDNEEVFHNLNNILPNLLNFICNKEKIDRKYDLSEDKFCFIEGSEIEGENDNIVVKILFKSARHSYRAPLLNRNTIEERENPKRMEEGEQVKTHLLIKFKENDGIVFLETGLGILTLTNIVEYFNSFIIPYNASHDDSIHGKLSFEMIPREDFREVLDSMNRVVCAEIFTEKSILGSDALNFSNSTEEVQENLVLTVKAEKKKSIKSFVYNVVSLLNGGGSEIKRIRVKGKLPNNNDSIIDTSLIIKKEYIEVEQNEDTGEFSTQNMFNQLKLLSNDY